MFCVIVGCCPEFFSSFARSIAFFAERKNNIAPETTAEALVYNLLACMRAAANDFKCVSIGGL
jgi:hypothetical protein